MKQLIAFLLPAALMAATAQVAAQADTARLDEVERRGSQVMPFDLAQTTHVFTKTDTGGVQQVVAKDNADSRQIQLIQGHLRKIAEEFRQGDFADPAKIHGADMPGLAALAAAKPNQLTIGYRDLPNGAEIVYSSAVPNLIAAIHKWFNAQLADHARHAVAGHPNHQMHHQ